MVKITEEMWAEKRARTIFITDMVEEQMGENDYESTDWSTIPLQDGSRARADAKVLAEIRAQTPRPSPEDIWSLIDDLEASADRENRPEKREQLKRAAVLIRATIRKEEGNVFFGAGDYQAAMSKYLEAMNLILGRVAIDSRLVLPSPCYFSKPYLDIGKSGEGPFGSWLEYMDLLALAGNISQCCNKQKQHVRTIDWIQEALQLFICQRQMTGKDLPSWKDCHLPIVEYWLFRIKTQLRAYNEFLALGNTALAAHFGQGAWVDYHQPDSKNYAKLAPLKQEMDYIKMFSLRHPDPNLIDKTKLTCPEVQVQGTWEKLPSPAPGPRPTGRCAHSSWIWQSRLYVCLGVGETQFEVDDVFWCLDLQTNVWKQLPKPPRTPRVGGLSSVRPMQIWRDKAYLFLGTQLLHVFDLVTERWSILKTTFQRGRMWPYALDKSLTSFTTAILENRLYVFGGDDDGDPLGQNIFMALDLLTNEWEHLSGSSENIPQSFEPNLRSLHCMWATPKQRKVYVLYGSANRTHARLRHAAGAGECDYTYDDFWSWHVDNKKWERERLRGSYPSPRVEAAFTFSDATGRAVVYGGYHGNMTTLEFNIGDRNTSFNFAFYGDTFVYDPETNMWQHVLVRGFPSYRAMSKMVCDPDTGKIYLFGGYTNPDFVPAKNMSLRVYNDVWTLKVDLPGGHWNPEDLTRDVRAERMGPWMRCFTCGNCGINWQKCAGACGGKYYFCSKDCQRGGWKEHKEKHGCRKL
ncbi:hypothetical protein F5050DRAFT_1741392 [Lentinula boryana]|uniref:Galactose oxidase n=1 Tax=Lentinula boryana TaxID=40481 RepID=A0ABQ8QK83_9AGAR|nr:hypothetical protein F5050DRAFT_1741392 [Lentinula boryana]